LPPKWLADFLENALYWHLDRFRCGHCLGLRYASKQQSGRSRRRQRVEALVGRAETENTPALFAKPAGTRAAAWRRVLHDFADAMAEVKARA
jgi:hypothetical protein